MAIISRGPKREEEPGPGAGLHLDLDLRVCPACRRELHPWEDTCPDDGVPGVDRTTLRRDDLPPPPAHLLDDDPDD